MSTATPSSRQSLQTKERVQVVLATVNVGAAPHPPAGTFSPYSDGAKGLAATSASFLQLWRLAKSFAKASFSPSLYAEKCPAGR
ncbi:conserved hypothetical protein [Mesorhizobium ventifaucium]|uniref:Uncharacterized protein n=1 Tax=Mesorhizobium ventifaucium TaxID=666020 RepID=A0ABM9E5A5_9HYPH|nr:conserved hypothetical protein [Mesorhizobium ventifaucium]